MSQIIPEAKRTLRVRQVADTLGIGVSSVWRLAKNDPEFPRPFSLSPRVTVWADSEVAEYVEAKKALRPAKQECAR
jgi:predicted DNA-binding transcriptional regulator AlpA